MWRKIVTACCALPLLLAAAPEIKFNVSGGFEISDIPDSPLIHMGSGWTKTILNHTNYKADAGFPKRGDNGDWQDSGIFKVSTGDIRLLRTLTPLGDDRYRFDIEAEAVGKPIETNWLKFVILLPVRQFGLREVDFGTEKIAIQPPEERKHDVYRNATWETLTIPCRDFKLKISGKVPVALNGTGMYYNGSDCALWFTLVEKEATQFQKGSLSLELTVEPYDTQPISLAEVANMAFADEIADDGKGGWNDQGAENDLRMFAPGRHRFRGARFDVVDPAKNNGKGCLVLSLERTPKQKSASLNFPARKMKNLLLLHASAWTPLAGNPIGTVTFRYADGSTSEATITADKEIGNWWAPLELANATVAWTGSNKFADVGLYLTEVPAQDKPVVGIDLTALPHRLGQKQHQWMIAGISSATEALPRDQEASHVIVESADWKPFRYNPADIEAGSIMDFSFLLDAPAGKHGPVVVRDGHFEFENRPGKPFRIYGVNISETTNFPARENAAKVAEAIAKSGYNSVRIHHFDNYLAAKTPEDRTELDPEMLDRLDYLAKQCKDRGIYLTLDLFVSREVPMKYLIGKDFPPINLGQYKRTFFISDMAMENLLKFTANLLNHVNPYTGIAWKDEPAVAFLSLVNEDPLSSWSGCSPEIRVLYDKAFDEFLAKRGKSGATGKEREVLVKKFCVETHMRGYRKIEKFLRDLGVKWPLTDQNCKNDPLLQNSRVQYDYVDNHIYGSHPWSLRQAWRLPSVVVGKSNLSVLGGTDFPPTLAARIYGKPYAITEFAFCKPNPFRAENGPFIGAYAGLQDWDALYRFQWSWADKCSITESTGGYFDVASDPIALLSDKIGMLLFTRGDVAPSQTVLTVIQSDNFNTTQGDLPPEIAQKLGFVAQTGMVLESGGKYAPPKNSTYAYRFENAGDTEKMLAEIQNNVDFGAGKIDLKNNQFVSTTGQVALDAEKSELSVITPASETLIRSTPGESRGKVLTVEIPGKSATVCAAAMDAKALKDSGRIMLLHLTDATESKIKFANAECTILENWGRLPHLARRGDAEITLRLAPGNTAPEVFALDMNGKRIENVVSQWNPDGTLRFKASVTGGKAPRFIYEILR